MPTNLPPQCREAEARYRSARTREEKIEALEEFLALMPKHKGTDKLQADTKARLAKLRAEPAGRSAAHGHGHVIPREGAGQIALVGPPNGGKSSLVLRLTHAEPRVADYPFTTRDPVPGMMPFEDVAIQLVNLPAVSTEHVEPWVFDLVRHADLVWLVMAAESCLEGLETTRSLLEAKKIRLSPRAEEPAGSDPPGLQIRRALIVLTGADRPGSDEDAAIFRSLLPEPWPVFLVSPASGAGLEELKRATFAALDVIRVYTKEPGHPPDRRKPFTLKRGARVDDLTRVIHKDLLAGFKFARVWGHSVFDGQQVAGDHPLEEGDVVEIHA